MALRPLFVAPGLVLLAALCACDTYGVLRRCGFQGCPADQKISAEVRARLNQRADLGPPNQLYVQTLNGVVYLSGQVATDLQRETADQIARGVAGVHQVVDTVALPYNGR